MRLDVEHEVLAARPLFSVRGDFEHLFSVDVPIPLPIGLVGGPESGREAQRAAQEGAALHSAALGIGRRQFAEAMLPVRLGSILRPRPDFLVGDHLGRNRGINALFAVALPFWHPHGSQK